MPTFYFCPATSAAQTSAVHDFARSYLTSVGNPRADDPDTVVDRPPPTMSLEDLLGGLDPSARSSVEAELARQHDRLASLAEQMAPPGDGDLAASLRYCALAADWRDHPAGTIVGVRDGTPAQVLAVFDGWTVGESGVLSYVTPAPVMGVERHPFPRKVAAAGMRATADPAQTFADTVLTLMNYIGQFLAMTGLPGTGLLISGLSAETQKAVDASFGHGPDLMTAFKKLLEANRIALENDLAGAQITNYRDYAGTHYSDAWLDEVMNAPDPMPPEVKEKANRLAGFVTKITEDFDTTCDLFTAVDLMRVSSPKPGDIHDVTEAMLKAEGFFYMSSVALTLGRQAFNAAYTMDGPKAAARIAGLLAAYSQIYCEYAIQLKASVDAQVNKRPTLLRSKNTGGEVWIWDDYYPTPADGQLAYSAKCCGAPDCGQKAAERDGILAQMRVDRRDRYRDELHARFWDGSHEKFEAAVQRMVDNNAKLQNLAAGCKGAS